MRAVFAALGLLLTTLVQAQPTGERVIIDRPVGHDLYAAGRLVALRAPLAGDFTVAGMAIEVEGPVEGDVNAAGESVRLSAPVADDVRTIGAWVMVENRIGDQLVAAGQHITVGPAARIGGVAWLAGSRVRVDGTVIGNLKVLAEQVVIDGVVDGNADIKARSIELLPGARIAGNLEWHSEHAPRIAEGAVGGRIVGHPLTPRQRPGGIRAVVFTAVIGLLAVLVTGTVGFLLFPSFSRRIAADIRSSPGKSFALGLAVFAATPVAVALLFLSGIGFLLGLLVLALYLVALPIGWLSGAFCTAEAVLGAGRRESVTRGIRLLAFVGAMVGLILLQLIPFLGLFVAAGVLLFGLGGLSLAIAGGYRHTVT